ncbi:MAG: DNA-directed RNA polymerase subunit omega [Lachnospiraceae bacterium]|nr:DNA-directed RNA polymerase subunit omega [Lachnospiraceae bacterium]
MIHPSYTDLMNVVNANVEPGDEPVVNSRYSIVLATAKRARQIINGAEPMVTPPCQKALSIAVAELNEGQVKILTGNEVVETIEDVTEGFEDEFGDELEDILDPDEMDLVEASEEVEEVEEAAEVEETEYDEE